MPLETKGSIDPGRAACEFGRPLAMSGTDIMTPQSAFAPILRDTHPTKAEGELLMKIVTDSQTIQRHYHLFMWLRGELQQLLPHEIFVAASGDFAAWQMKIDVVSALPGVRTAQLARCSVDQLVEALHTQWVAGGRQPLFVRMADIGALIGSCTCPLHNGLRSMQSLLVHGVRDMRDGYDSIYLAFDRGRLGAERPKDRFLFLLDLLVTQIDSAFRRVAALPLLSMKGHAQAAAGDWQELSARELEILDWICRGKTNIDIATALDISPFTVKNHLQRIFRKIGVSNRTQAATKYNQALRDLRSLVAR